LDELSTAPKQYLKNFSESRLADEIREILIGKSPLTNIEIINAYSGLFLIPPINGLV
jgi:hypothetical protein